jgi:hypothetical protein
MSMEPLQDNGFVTVTYAQCCGGERRYFEPDDPDAPVVTSEQHALWCLEAARLRQDARVARAHQFPLPGM